MSEKKDCPEKTFEQIFNEKARGQPRRNTRKRPAIEKRQVKARQDKISRILDELVAIRVLLEKASEK